MQQTCVAAFGVALALQAPAVALGFNLTGEWQGTVNCRAFDGTSFRLPRSTMVLLISHSGDAFAARLESGSGPTDYVGRTVDMTGQQARLEGILIECRTMPSMDDRAEVVHLKAKQRNSGSRLKGTSIFRGQAGEIGTCRWNFTLTSDVDPELAACP